MMAPNFTEKYRAELFQGTMKTIKKHDMMKRVNSNFTADLTLEDILTSIGLLRRYLAPFLAVCGISFGMWIFRVIRLYFLTVFYHFQSVNYNVVDCGKCSFYRPSRL